MRPLTARQVITCEDACKPRCRCRCGGVFHGAARSQLVEYFEKLPASDPHWRPEQDRQLPLPPPFEVVAA